MSLHKPFEEEWNRAKPLHKGQIAKYANARPKSVRVYQPSGSLRAILGGRPRQDAVRPVERQYWRDRVGGFVCKETEDIISESTNWDDLGYGWYVSGEPRHRIGDRIVFFDLPDGYVQLIEVVDTTRTPERTPDGQRFTAYRQVADSHRRRLGQTLWRKLKAASLISSKNDVRAAKKLRPHAFRQFCEVLGC